MDDPLNTEVTAKPTATAVRADYRPVRQLVIPRIPAHLFPIASEEDLVTKLLAANSSRSVSAALAEDALPVGNPGPDRTGRLTPCTSLSLIKDQGVEHVAQFSQRVRFDGLRRRAFARQTVQSRSVALRLAGTAWRQTSPSSWSVARTCRLRGLPGSPTSARTDRVGLATCGTGFRIMPGSISVTTMTQGAMRSGRTSPATTAAGGLFQT